MNGRSSVFSSLLLGAALLLVPLTLVSIPVKSNLTSGEVYISSNSIINLVKDFFQDSNQKKQDNFRTNFRTKAESQTANKPLLKKKGYSYVISKLNASHGRKTRKLRPINPRGRLIFNTAVTLRDYFKDEG
ncbi:MAG: hypothetical protein HC908_04455 [Calothrix sp. SM1_7_51]|nr:hypothetical protein [Calothrix sp. SM1_7_51]